VSLANKPDGKDAPAWANFRAMDANGSWWWYEQRPRAGDDDEARFFRSNAGGQMRCASEPTAEDWQGTLESRPPAEQAEQNVNDA